MSVLVFYTLYTYYNCASRFQQLHQGELMIAHLLICHLPPVRCIVSKTLGLLLRTGRPSLVHASGLQVQTIELNYFLLRENLSL